MAGAGKLFLSKSEGALITLVNIVLIFEICDRTLKQHSLRHCVYSRLILLAHAPLAAFLTYRLFALVRRV